MRQQFFTKPSKNLFIFRKEFLAADKIKCKILLGLIGWQQPAVFSEPGASTLSSLKFCVRIFAEIGSDFNQNTPHMAVKITYFVHGTTTDNEKHSATGWASGELSQLGIKQSKELGPLVADKNFDIVFCSDLKRTVDSAHLSFGDKYKIIQDERLREANYGDFTQHPSKSFKQDMTEWIDKKYPNGESYKDVEKRLADFLKFLKKDYQGKHIAIVSHEAPQLALDVLLKNKTWERAIKENWRHTKSWQPGWEYVAD